VCLVHGNQGDWRAGGEVAESAGFQSFRSHVQQFELTRRSLGEHHGLLIRGLGGVDKCGRQAQIIQGIDLITHEGDQRRDHDGNTGHERGGNLVAHGFAGTGGHNAQYVPAIQQSIDDALLAWPERIVTEVLLERPQRRLMCRHASQPYRTAAVTSHVCLFNYP